MAHVYPNHYAVPGTVHVSSVYVLRCTRASEWVPAHTSDTLLLPHYVYNSTWHGHMCTRRTNLCLEHYTCGSGSALRQAPVPLKLLACKSDVAIILQVHTHV